MSKRILFVDDEPRVLMGLQRSLRSMKEEWDMNFVSGGPEALACMSEHPFDVVVTDMRMPEMDGASLLDEVRIRYPETVRIVLSGQSDKEAVFRSISPAHQYLSKPCDPELLKSTLIHTFALRSVLANPNLKKVVSQLKNVPSLPSLYLEVNAELQSPDPSPNRVAKIISEDIGMTAKILQLVNSAAFFFRSNVSQAAQAVQLLGLDTIQALVLSFHIFSEFKNDFFTEDEITFMWNHAIKASHFAKAIARLETDSSQMIDDCFTAGLLHDIGKLIFASACGEQYRRAFDLAAARSVGSRDLEREILGCTHAEVGAYLLGLWGLPHPIVEAVAWHQKPLQSTITQFSPLIAVHVASIFAEKAESSPAQDRTPLDVAFLERIGLERRFDLWASTCQDMQRRVAEN